MISLMQALVHILTLTAGGVLALWLRGQKTVIVPAPKPGDAPVVVPPGPAAPVATPAHPFLSAFEQELMKLGGEALSNLWQNVLRGGFSGVPIAAPPTLPAAPAPK